MSGASYQRVIQVELNEISSDIVSQLIARGLLPTFARIHAQWKFIQTTSEEQYEHLEPWIQWVTAHTGKSFAEHGIFRLGDASELRHPQIWEALSDRGIESAIVGSMNCTRGANTRGGLFFPDPWAKSAVVHPPELQPLWDLISARVQGHATSELHVADLWAALKSTAQFGIPVPLYARIARQLVEQKLDKLSKWRLALLFDELIAHIFTRVLEQPNMRFCTVFLNAIAHYQHHYWRNFDRALFNPSVAAPDCHESDDPILEGYQAYDRILGRILARTRLDNTLVIVASGLSQVPFLSKESQGGMNYYRLKDHQGLLRAAGLPAAKAFPMMSRDWQVRASDAAALEQVAATLRAVTIAGEALFSVTPNIDGHLFVETAITRGVAAHEQVRLGERVLGTFGELFVNIAVKSGMHTGVGSLWLSDGAALPAEYRQAKSLPLTQLYALGLDALTARAELGRAHEERQSA